MPAGRIEVPMDAKINAALTVSSSACDKVEKLRACRDDISVVAPFGHAVELPFRNESKADVIRFIKTAQPSQKSRAEARRGLRDKRGRAD